MTIEELAPRLLEELSRKGFSLAVAESCTGGNIAHQITLVPGASTVFNGGAVTYTNNAKSAVLGVTPYDLRHGAVSQETALAMAYGAGRVFEAPCVIATTGIAGPTGGTANKPVGTVWVAFGILPQQMMQAVCLHLKGSRADIINQASFKAMELLYSALMQPPETTIDYRKS